MPQYSNPYSPRPDPLAQSNRALEQLKRMGTQFTSPASQEGLERLTGDIDSSIQGYPSTGGEPLSMVSPKSVELSPWDRTRADAAEARQREEVDAVQTANLQALLGGFRGGPGQIPAQEMGGYQRRMAEREMEIPLEQQRIASGADMERARIAAQGQVDVAKEQGRTWGQRYDAFGNLLGGGANLAPGSSVTLPGGGGVRTAQPSGLASQLNQLATLRGQYLEDPGTGFGANPQARGAYEQALANVMFSLNIPPDVAESVRDIALNPELGAMSVNEILANLSYEDGSPLSPEDQAAISRYLPLVLARGL